MTAREVELRDMDPGVLRYVQRHADLITIVSSEYLRDWVAMTRCEEKFRVVHNGVDLGEFRQRTRRSANGRVRLVSVARLVPHKRIADGIRAVHQLVHRGIDVGYHIVSDGPERPALEALRTELQLDDRVRFLGFLPRSEVIGELMESDVLLHPSEAEGFGVAVIEGMAAGLPVVVARSGGCRTLSSMGTLAICMNLEISWPGRPPR